jgi:hypothetical protein
LSFVLTACSSNPVPKGIIAPEKMEKIVYDIMQTDEYINSFLYKDTTLDIKKERSIYYEKVFKLHNTNRKEFYTSFKYYRQHPDIQKILFDSLHESVKKKAPEPIKRKPIRSKEI